MTEWQRCTKCEELRRGFTYRTLINGMCGEHACEALSGQFVKITFRIYYRGNEAGERVRYGFLRYFGRAGETRIKVFSNDPVEGGFYTNDLIVGNNVVNIEVLTTEQYMAILATRGEAQVFHFGKKHGGRIIQTARTRVLVRFRGNNGKSYERWKPVYAVQPNMLAL